MIIFTMLRSVLILNGIYDYGRSIWSGDTEGTGFLRFYAVLYTVVGGPASSSCQLLYLPYAPL